jgi:SNF2 family DNA or RNA helicase
MQQNNSTNSTYLKLFRKNRRQHELQSVETHKQDVAQQTLKRKLAYEKAYDEGYEEVRGVEENDDQKSFILCKPMSLVLSELKHSDDGRLVHSDLVSRGRYQLTTKKQKRFCIKEAATYLAKRPLIQLADWQEANQTFIENREADRERIGTGGGMLCDEMGLGKTISMLVYMQYDNQRCYRQTGNRYNGATLVAVQNKLLLQGWLDDIRTNWPSNSFEYYVLQSTKNRLISRVYIENCCDFVIVTYSTIKAAYSHKLKRERAQSNHMDEDEEQYEADGIEEEDEKEDEEEEDDDRDEDDDAPREEKESAYSSKVKPDHKRLREQDYRSDILYGIRWKRIVADESHNFANKKTYLYKAMMALESAIKWGVTGTPIQNRLADIFSNFDFIGVPPVIPSLTHYASIKDCDVSEDDRVRIKEMLNKVMTRKLKCEIAHLDSKMAMMPIKKTIKLIEFESLFEKVIYYLYATYGSRNWRSVVDHTTSSNNTTTLSTSSTKKTSIASILQLMMQLCIGMRIVSDLVLPHGMLTLGNEEELHLRETPFKETLFEMPLESLNYAKNDNTLEYLASRLSKRTVFSHKSNNNTLLSLPDGYTMEYRASLESEAIVAAGNHSDEMAQADREESFKWDPFKKDKHFDLTGSAKDREQYTALYESLRENGIENAKKMMKEAKAVKDRKKQAMVSHLVARTLRAPHYSTKNRHIIKYIKEEVPVEDKVIVFSNSIRGLQTLEKDLATHGIKSIMVNGTTSDNIDRIARFKESCPLTGAKVLLLSLKLGNVGLNIICANHIIFTHAWWNPSVIEQAENRAHRLGQLKVVHIVHFIINHTIDLYVLNLSHDKKFMTNAIMGSEKETLNKDADELAPPMEDVTTERINQCASRLYDYSITQY